MLLKQLTKNEMKPFCLSVYLEAAGLLLLDKESGRLKSLFELLKELGVEKVYLETYRGLEGAARQHSGLISPELVKRLKIRFESEGFRTACGMCVGTWNEGFGGVARSVDNDSISVNCFNSPDTITFYEKVFEEAGQLFDEVLLDDWLFNDCFCDNCIKSFSENVDMPVTRSELKRAFVDENGDLFNAWNAHAAKILAAFASDMIRTFKLQCPGGIARWKMPEWISRYRSHGINPELHRDLWDGFLIGAEAREGVEAYASVYAYHYLRAQFAEKAQGVWFDILSGFDWSKPMSVNRFVNQMKMSVLSGAPEIVLWCYPEICQPGRSGHIKALMNILPDLKPLSLLCHGFRGLPTVQRFGACEISSPESSIFDRFGEIGLSIAQQSSITQDDRGLLVTEHSDLTGLDSWVLDGGKAIVTSGGIRSLVNSGLASLVGLDMENPFAAELAFVTNVEFADGRLHKHHRGHEVLSLPFGPIVNPQNATVIVWGRHKNGRFPLVLRNSYGKGEVVALCITDVPHCMTGGQAEPLSQLFRDLFGEVTGIQLGPDIPGKIVPRVILLPFEKMVVLFNLEDCPISLELRVNPKLANVSLESIEADAGGWQQKKITMDAGEIVCVALTSKKNE